MPEEDPATPGRAVGHGAEARVRAVEWLGFPALLKERDLKAYRPKALDDRLRRERTRTEARLLIEVRRIGIRTPVLYDIDLPHHRLTMEELPGPTLKQLLEGSNGTTEPVTAPIQSFGRTLGKLHAHGISHGDLTSSNVLFPDGPAGAPAFIDLSMGDRSAGIEELGIDLHLVEEDLKGLHPEGEALYKVFLEGYSEGNPTGQKDVRKRAKEIKGRVRYA